MKMLPTLHLYFSYRPRLRKRTIMLWHHFLGPASVLTSAHCRLFPKHILLVSTCSFLLDGFGGRLEGLFTSIWVKTQGPEDLWAASSLPISCQTHSVWHFRSPGEKKSFRHYQPLEEVYKSLLFHLKTQVEQFKIPEVVPTWGRRVQPPLLWLLSSAISLQVGGGEDLVLPATRLWILLILLISAYCFHFSFMSLKAIKYNNDENKLQLGFQLH